MALNDSFPEIADIGAYELQLDSIIVSMTTWADSDDPNVSGAIQSIPNTHSRINRIVLTFSQAVSVVPTNPVDAFSLKQMAPTGNGAVTLSVSPTTDTTSITLKFSGSLTEEITAQNPNGDKYNSLKDGWYQLIAFADDIVSAFGVPIDGNNDGDPGDNFATPTDTNDAKAIYRLFGDAGTDHWVSGSDFNLFRMSFGGSDPIFDFNGDGSVSGSDFNQFRLRFGGGI